MRGLYPEYNRRRLDTIVGIWAAFPALLGKLLPPLWATHSREMPGSLP
jgi:hypothetical protein